MEQNDQQQNGFSYTYSAREQAELKKIREKYIAPTQAEDKMARLRKLDASVTDTAQAIALVFGVLGTLILGFGMSLCMTELSALLGAHSDLSMVIGIIVGVIGGILASLAYPVYNAIVKAKRKKLAPEILRLADELMKS
jgi:sorbitol-specific phosphotransferase system component IIBC